MTRYFRKTESGGFLMSMDDILNVKAIIIL